MDFSFHIQLVQSMIIKLTQKKEGTYYTAKLP